jgi:fumarylacetoacetase
LANIPFGVISSKLDSALRPAVAIGDYALDLKAFAAGGGFQDLTDIQPHLSVFNAKSLNGFASLGQPTHRLVRRYLQDVFKSDTHLASRLRDNESLKRQALIPLTETNVHLPMEIGDYTDFFAGINHAHKVGSLFRGPQNALQPNYKHLPVAYHSRASSVVVSGTDVIRPWGQVLLDPAKEPKIPTFMPCRRLDIELELGAFVCGNNFMGRPISIKNAAQYVFGYVLMNDWSARDIQTWEYVPLGPFNAKNFATTISGWVVLQEALAPFATKGIENDVGEIQDYLKEGQEKTQYDIRLRVDLTSKF